MADREDLPTLFKSGGPYKSDRDARRFVVEIVDFGLTWEVRDGKSPGALSIYSKFPEFPVRR